MTATVGVIVVAAGMGTRLGADEPKALAALAGSTILRHGLRPIAELGDDVQIIVVGPADHLDACRTEAVAAGVAPAQLQVVAGGSERDLSVRAGLAALSPSVEIVLVHDAARALTSADQFRRVIDAVRASGSGVVPTTPIVDTIRWIGAGERLGDLADRSQLAAMQTPQGFPRSALAAAYDSAPEGTTDDAAVWASAGGEVIAIPGEDTAFKITTRADLQRAEHLLEAAVTIRTGIGIDVHAYTSASPLWLAGLFWPDEPGLEGHSDGDAVAHAICDALLSAAGLGDIGSRFGTSDPQYANAAGDVFLTATRELLSEAGFRIGNVSVQIVGNSPRVGPRRLEAEQRLSAILGAPVSVSATTSDGLGFTGRGEGLTAVATAIVQAS
jgi:2-C-methyl-D-erythritol 4-phosphate cytidylyltransferase/2-C-methyl-D-erythritol 2,4-cyclodiphosphate synthase